MVRRLNRDERASIAHALMHLMTNKIADDDYKGNSGWYCGNREQFVKRHKKSVALMRSLLAPNDQVDRRGIPRTLDPIVRLPKWAQRRIAELQERVKRAEATIPWTAPGMEWFTLFWPGPEPKARAPQKLFTCGDGGTHCVCTLGPEDYVFVGRGKKPNAALTGLSG
jgi:hypothetical protein